MITGLRLQNFKAPRDLLIGDIEHSLHPVAQIELMKALPKLWNRRRAG
jgi:cobalamin biosynthesis protein CobD/CbiB